MPLPPPMYPPVVPASFLGEQEQATMNLGLQLFGQYHPAAVRQRLYENLLASEQWRAEQQEKQRDFLVEQMRNAQKEYFRTRSNSALHESKRLEKKLDRCVAMVLDGQKDLFPRQEVSDE